MPWFHRKSDEEKQREQQQRAAQEASVAALQRGELPLPAQARIADMRQREDRFFTSDLSVYEFLLSRQAGIRPISQVMGSSVYHVGYQYIGSWSSSGELDVISRAHNDVRSLALGRMREEALRLGAHVVVGVHIESRPLRDASDLIEYLAFGTACRVEGATDARAPGLTNLSGQDFWKLYRAGYWPLGVTAGTTVYYQVASWSTQWATGWGSWANQELTDFTAGLYNARHLAMRRVQNEGHRLNCSGVVGVEIEQSEEEYEVELPNDRHRTDMIFTFHVIGTAITPLAGEQQRVPVIPAVVVKP
jgi:uncharacterized protein YbjQ (UPF0145 family)